MLVEFKFWLQKMSYCTKSGLQAHLPAVHPSDKEAHLPKQQDLLDVPYSLLTTQLHQRLMWQER